MMRPRSAPSLVALAFVLSLLVFILFIIGHTFAWLLLPAWPYGICTTLMGTLPPLLTAFLLYFLYKSMRNETAFVQSALTVSLIVVALATSILTYKYAAFASIRYAWPAFAAAVVLMTLAPRHTALPVRILNGTRNLVFYAVFLIILIELPLLYFHMRMYTATKSEVLDFPDLFDGENPGLLKKNLNEPMLLGDGSTGLVRTNASGFRSNHEMILPKPADELRLLFLGDSFTIGYRTEQSKTAATLLEERLQTAFPNRRVRIFVARAMDQTSLKLWLRKNRGRFDEDAIIHGITIGNDLPVAYVERYLMQSTENLSPLEYYAREFGRIHLPPSALESGAGRTRVCSLLPEDQLRCLRLVLRLETLIGLFRPTAIYNYRSAEDGKVMMWDQQNDLGLFLKELHPSGELFYETEERVLAEIADEQNNGAPLFYFLYPQRFQQSEAEWEATRDWFGLNTDAFDLEQPNRRILAMCAKHGLTCRDLLPAFRAHGDELLHYPYDMHWNNAGNAVAAEAMAEYLKPRLKDLLKTSRK